MWWFPENSNRILFRYVELIRHSLIDLLSATVFFWFPFYWLSSSISSGFTQEVLPKFSQLTLTFYSFHKPNMKQYHKELTVRIESLTNLGFGIARVPLDEENDEGSFGHDASITNVDDNKMFTSKENKKWVVMVPNSIPGELVLVRIYRNYASYSDADLVQILEPSLDRIDPQCSLAGICGGCQYQHMTIERQRKMKTMQVQELFERLGGLKAEKFPSVLETLGTDEVFGYRSKITPHYEAPLRSKPQKKNDKSDHVNDGTSVNKSFEIGPIGFKEKASRRLVDVPYCHIATPAINTALFQLRAEKRAEALDGRLKKPTRGATLLLRDAGEGVVETDPNKYVNTRVKGLLFRFQAGNFFQVRKQFGNKTYFFN